jgi:tRNA(fMet)-specific endonuclease VapC
LSKRSKNDGVRQEPGGDSMEPALIDTNIISMFMRGHPAVRDRFAAYVKEHDRINLSIITIYEALSGLKHRDAKKQTATFRALVEGSEVWPLTVSDWPLRCARISLPHYASAWKVGFTERLL